MFLGPNACARLAPHHGHRTAKTPFARKFGVDLKRRPPKSRPAISAKGCPSKETARRDSAVHVSLSSDSPVKQPGTNMIPPSDGTGGSSKPKVVEAGGPPITIGSLVTEYR
jgi:hypothetical protein